MCALSLGGLCQQPHKSLRAETCVAENWAEYSSGKFENRLVLKLSGLPLGNRHFFVLIH